MARSTRENAPPRPDYELAAAVEERHRDIQRHFFFTALREHLGDGRLERALKQAGIDISADQAERAIQSLTVTS